MSLNLLIDIQGNEISFENCSICLEKLENNKYQIQECKHEFHSNCLLSFFRTGNTSCPLCRSMSTITNSGCNSFSIKTILNYSKRKNANKGVVNMVKNYKKIKELEKESKKELSEFIKKHKEIFSIKRKLINKKWRTFRRLRQIKNNIASIVVLPINTIR
jgi:hypothetical protein